MGHDEYKVKIGCVYNNLCEKSITATVKRIGLFVLYCYTLSSGRRKKWGQCTVMVVKLTSTVDQ